MDVCQDVWAHHAVLPIFSEPQRQVAQRLRAGFNGHFLVVCEAMHLQLGLGISGSRLSGKGIARDLSVLTGSLGQRMDHPPLHAHPQMSR